MSATQHDPAKKKRKRTMITKEHAEKLEDAFETEPWPNRSQKEELASDMGKDMEFVSIWFQNKRARIRREEQKELKRTILRNKTKIQALSSQKIPISRNYGDSSQKQLPTSTMTTESKIASSTPAMSALLQKPKLSSQTHVEQPSTPTSQVTKTSTATTLNTETVESASITPPKSLTPGVNIAEQSVDTGVTKKLVDAPKFFTTVQVLPNVCRDDVVRRKQVVGDELDCKDLLATAGLAGAPAVASMQQGASTSTANKHQPLASRQPKMKYTDNNSPWGQNIPSASIVSPENGRQNPFTLYRAIVRMVALVEGGIIDQVDPDFQPAINDALYGIVINGNSRLIYDQDSGLEFVSME